MKILVTGANGYIGSKMVVRLLDMGHTVIATDLLNEHIDHKAIIKQCDIFIEKENWFEYFEKPDICLHMAWRDGFVHNSTKHITDLSKHFSFLNSMIKDGLRHLTVMGSMHEVGYHEGVVNESTPTNPKTYYGIAKNALREALEYLCEENDVVFQWLRGFYIFGDDLYGNSIFCKIKQAALNGQKTFPFTTGKNKFDFVSIGDLTQQIACATVQKKINGIINVCSGEAVSLGEKIEWYIKANHLDIQLEYGKYKERQTESPCIYGDSSKIKEILKGKNQRILVTGVKGQLGFDCVRELKGRGYTNVKGIDIEELDITNETAVQNFIQEFKPDVVIHNAAWTAVDKAEQMAERVYAINALGPKYIVQACKQIGAKLVYISTDYVFDGKGDTPFEVDSPKNGLSVYGKSKALGEDYIINSFDQYFIVRITGGFGINGNNFVKTMIKLAKMGKTELSVVCDQIGSVTYTRDLAKLLCDMIETEKFGIYHATNEGFISWAEFAEEIFRQTKLNVKVNYVTTEEYKRMVPNQADRPLNSRMSKESLTLAGFERLPDWKDALKRYLEELL